MSTRTLQLPVLLCLVLLVAACANTAPGGGDASTAGEDAVSTERRAEPELTLNLPEPECICVNEENGDYTFYEKGIRLLLAGEHAEAVDSFQRYQRLESSPEAQWEAAIAIAYDRMLPQSPFYDPQAALAAFEALQEVTVDTRRVQVKTLLIRDALANFLQLQSQLDQLASDNRQLTENLQKREEALKRLRELTLGQRAATP